MTGRSNAKLQELNREIRLCRNELDLNEGQVLSQLSPSQASTPQRTHLGSSAERIFTPSQRTVNSGIGTTQGRDPEEVKIYLKTLKKLQGKLEEKSHLMEADGEKQKWQYEREIESLGQDLSQSNRELQQKSETIKVISKQVKQLEEDLAHYRRESVIAKEDNKKYRADNKIIMKQIDRLTQNHSTPEEKQKVSDQREMRVIKALYRDSVPQIEQREEARRYETSKDLSNKIKLDGVSETNEELKALIRRLNEEVSMLKAENSLLNEENHQKLMNLDNQKQIVSLSEESNGKLNEVIQKMGDKIISLEMFNQTLRQKLNQGDEGLDASSENYYLKTRAKAGQFYYKR